MSFPNTTSFKWDGQANAMTRWLVRLLGYDGLLPAFVFLLPAALALLFKGWVIEFTALALPIVAFLYRLKVGLQLIDQNACNQIIRMLQKTALFFGLLVLVLVDAFMILAWSIPAGALKFGDYQIFLLLYAIYLFLMALASFPGTTDANAKLRATSDSATYRKFHAAITK